MKFQAKPVIVDAQQWFPPGDERHDPTMLSDRKGNAVEPPDYRRPWDIYRFAHNIDVFFLRGENMNDQTKLVPGDWIVTAADGSKRAVRQEAFEVTFEPAGAERSDVE